MKKQELRKLIKEVLTEETPTNYNYIQSQLEKAEQDHDWTYKMGVKFYGTKGQSKVIGLDQGLFDAIKKLLSSRVASKKISTFADRV